MKHEAYLQENRYGEFSIWDDPLREHKYVVGVDTAEGKVRDIGASRRALASREGQRDYSAAVVLELETAVHVATWHGSIPVTDWGYVVAAIGHHYNDALVIPEANGPGVELIGCLTRRVDYPNIYISKLFGNLGGDDLGGKWGWRTTEQTRPILVARIEEALNHNRAFTRDHRLIKELRTMEIDVTGKARAKHPNHDDLVIAFGLALQGRFEELYHVQSPAESRSDLDDLPHHDREFWLKERKRRKQIREQTHGSRSSGFRGDGLLGPGHRPSHRWTH